MKMKLMQRVLLLAAVCVSAVSCLVGKGYDEFGPDGEDTVFSAIVSPTVIAADGVDAAVFEVRFRGELLTADEVVFYNAEDDSVVEMPDMKFTTLEQGVYSFYVKFENPSPAAGEESVYTSDILEVTATNYQIDLEPNDQTGLTTSLSSTVVQTGTDRAIIVVRFNGEVLNDGYDIYDAQTNKKVTLPTMQMTSKSGITYDLHYYSTEKAETRSFWVGYGVENTFANPMNVTSVDFDIPARPIDPQPENTAFKRRSMIMQFTGLGCGYCPYMIAALRTVFEDPGYASSAVLAAIHTYSGDPMAPSEPLENAFGISGYPTLIFDMNTQLGNYGYNTNITNIKKCIDNSLATPAKAGISARMSMDDNTLIVRMVIKVNESGDYRVGAWLLENGLSGKQTDYGMGGDFSTHDNVVRRADSKDTYSASYAGHDMGHLNAGDTADYVFVISLDPEWVLDNCHLLLFVSSLEGKSYRVTNAVANTSLTEAVAIDYE